MTLPDERSRAVKNTREFMRALLNPRKTPRVPRKIREQAYWCLRHFPSDMDIYYASEDSPEIFGPVKYEETD